MASALPFGEVFGFDVKDQGAEARRHRKLRLCPFQGAGALCTKAPAANPLGICSYSAGDAAVTVCPKRFMEKNRLFRDVALLAFGKGATVIACPEIHILRVGKRRVGKVDYLLVNMDAGGEPHAFAALEVQSVYKSGKSVRREFDDFIETGKLSKSGRQRPDFRSSAQKRLMPQLILKIPVFRRWGTKFFVAVDNEFFTSLPIMEEKDSLVNSEVTWLVYPFGLDPSGIGYGIGQPRIVYTTLDQVQTALREGEEPKPGEILAECKEKIAAASRRNRPLPRVKT